MAESTDVGVKLGAATSHAIERQLRPGAQGRRGRLPGACPVVASFGARDRFLRAAPRRLDRALGALGIEHDIKVYPDAGHAFLSQSEDTAGMVARILARVTYAGYQEASARDAADHRLLRRALEGMTQKSRGRGNLQRGEEDPGDGTAPHHLGGFRGPERPCVSRRHRQQLQRAEATWPSP